MTVRTATTGDALQIAHVHVETWRAAYRGQIPGTVLDALDEKRRAAFWHQRLMEARGWVFVAEHDGVVVGFCDLVPSRDRDANPQAVAEIVAIYIVPRHWRQGAGRMLCQRALTEARRGGYETVTLWTLASNDGAKCLYQAMGFSPDGAVKTEKAADGSDLREVRFRIAICSAAKASKPATERGG